MNKNNIRLASVDDFSDICNLLNQLTDIGKPTKQILINILKTSNINMYVTEKTNDKNPDNKNPDNNKKSIVGCITLLTEQKLIHSGKCVGHIEDVVVDEKHRNKGIGAQMIRHCIDICKQSNCYKIILDCNIKNIIFYEKMEFIKYGTCMRFDINK